MSYIERMNDELADLAVKLKALDAFINSDASLELSHVNRQLLVQQRNAMVDYLKILAARIAIQ